MSEENTNTAIVTHTAVVSHRNPNPFEKLLSLFQNFKLQLTQPKKQSEDPKSQKPGVVVTFPERRKLPDPIKLHDDDSDSDATTNNHQKSPAVMWQIYAVGAYVIASWAWNQWQKKKGLKNPSDNDEQNDD